MGKNKQQETDWRVAVTVQGAEMAVIVSAKSEAGAKKQAKVELTSVHPIIRMDPSSLKILYVQEYAQ